MTNVINNNSDIDLWDIDEDFKQNGHSFPGGWVIVFAIYLVISRGCFFGWFNLSLWVDVRLLLKKNVIFLGSVFLFIFSIVSVQYGKNKGVF